MTDLELPTNELDGDDRGQIPAPIIDAVKKLYDLLEAHQTEINAKLPADELDQTDTEVSILFKMMFLSTLCVCSEFGSITRNQFIAACNAAWTDFVANMGDNPENVKAN